MFYVLLLRFLNIQYKFQKMSQEALKYLQKDDIGKVIAKGLANLYTNKPERPIKYLAEWLKSFSKNKKQFSNIILTQKTKSDFLHIYEQTNKIKQLTQKQKSKKDQQRWNKIKQFQDMVAKHQYQEQLLEQILPEFVEKFTDITGAYVGELNFPPKDITEKDTDQNAHLNTDAEKVINYIGSSVSHKNLMRGKILKLNQGVTAKVFTLAEQQAPVVGEDGVEVPKQEKQSFVYIPNVVKNQSMHYFRIPKLGAYLAVPLIYKSSLTEKIFDQVLAQKKKQLNELDEFNRKKADQIDQLTKTKQQLAKKVHDLKQKHADESQIEPFSHELADIEKKIKDKQQQKYKQQPITPNFIKNNYVFCVDNLGKDQQLSSEDIKLITKLIDHFKVSWQEKEKQLLFKDIATQIKYLQELPQSPEAIKQSLEKHKQIDEEQSKQINQIEDQFLRNYKIQEEEYNRLKNYVKGNQIFLSSFLKLKEFRVIKYKELIQNVLYFLGETKDNINIPKRAGLNWKNAKTKYITKQTFNSILNYVVQGPKEKNYNFYHKTPLLLEILQKQNQDEIFTYNIGLGTILVLIKRALKHRINNVKLRKLQREKQRKDREALIEQNAKIDIQKEQELKEHKDNLPIEQVQSFKQQEWISKFEKDNPKHEVPAEVIDDIDNDM